MLQVFNEKITISDANAELIMKESNPIDIGTEDHKTLQAGNQVRPEIRPI